MLAQAAGAGLSPKFGVLVDGGGAVHVRGRRQDVCLGAVRLAEGSWGYEVRLGQALPEVEPELDDVAPVVVVSPEDAGNLVRGAVALLADHPAAGGRMSGLVTLLGGEEVLRRAAVPHDIALATVAGRDVARPAGPSLRPIGQLPQRGARQTLVGAMPVLGRLSGPQLGAIAERGGRVL